MPTSKTAPKSARASTALNSAARPSGKRRGAKPLPIIEFPEPLFSDWIDPATFQEALALHMRRHGDTSWHLWKAVIQPGEILSRDTVKSWVSAKRIPRSLTSLDFLSRIERRYRLPVGYFRALLPHRMRAAIGHKLKGIAPAEQRRLAWHLPDDFNDRSAKERNEILNWVREHILSGSTDYRRFQAAAMKHRYAIRFPALTGRRPGSSSMHDTNEDKDPDILAVAMDAPAGLAREMADLVSFKTATLTAIGFRRNGVWGEETSAQKIEHLGLMFGALAASPTGAVAGFGVPLTDLSFGLLVFPAVWDWYVQWRERRRGFYTGWESEMLRLVASLTRPETGWMRQTPELARRLCTIPNLVSACDVEAAKSNWTEACDAVHVHALARAREIDRVAQVHRDPFEPILPILEADSPVGEYRRITEEILRNLPDERRYWKQISPKWKPNTLETHDGYRRKHLDHAFAGMYIDEIEQADVLAWFNRVSTRSGPGAGNRCFEILRAMFNHAERWGMRPEGSNPCSFIRLNRRRKCERFLSNQEITRLGEVLRRKSDTHPLHATIVYLLLLTGCRLSEIVDLTWSEVKGGKLLLHDSKTGPRTVWLGDEARGLLEKLERRGGSVPVFWNKLTEQPVRDISRFWVDVKAEASLPNVRLHDLRHSFASHAAARSETLPMIAKLLGHARLHSTWRYAHLDDGPVIEAAERVGELIHAAIGGV